MNTEHFPLVSVPVLAYNSSDTIIETLDSIYEQTYPNIDLVISDDCSTDNTIDICKEWLKTHKDRFTSAQILSSEKNTGVSGNLNRAEEACTGEWEKLIAGDDIMLSNCIQDCIDYVREHPDSIVVFGKMIGFGADEEYVNNYMNYCFNYSFFSLPIKEQYDYLIFKGNPLPAPAFFCNREKIKNIGIINDERIPLLEDYPKWINMLKAGIRLDFLNKEIVKYRFSPNALSTTNKPSVAKQKSYALLYIYYIFPELWKKNKLKAISQYIEAAHIIWGGIFWNSLYYIRNFKNKLR